MAEKAPHSREPFDYWTLAHAAVAAFLGWSIRDPVKVAGILVGWEILEQGALAKVDHWWSEAPANTLTDLSVGFLAATIASGGWRQP